MRNGLRQRLQSPVLTAMAVLFWLIPVIAANVAAPVSVENEVRAAAHRLEVARPSTPNAGAERRTEPSRFPKGLDTAPAEIDQPSAQKAAATAGEPLSVERAAPRQPRRLAFPYDANAPPHVA